MQCVECCVGCWVSVVPDSSSNTKPLLSFVKLSQGLFFPCAAGASSFQSLATPALPDPLGTLLNQSTNYANIISNAHPDPVPSNLVNLLVENPLGPQLDAAFKALPSVQVCNLLPTALQHLGNCACSDSGAQSLVYAMFG